MIYACKRIYLVLYILRNRYRTLAYILSSTMKQDIMNISEFK